MCTRLWAIVPRGGTGGHNPPTGPHPGSKAPESGGGAHGWLREGAGWGGGGQPAARTTRRNRPRTPTHRSTPVTDDRPHHDLTGPPTAPPLVLGPSIGTSLAVWEPQLPALARGHRVLRWDLPGHGRSPAALLPSDGSATIDALAALVLRLADEQGWERFAYAGISIGGAVGLHLAAHHPDRVGCLSVVCSSARFGDPAVWRERAALVRAEGTEAMVASRPGTWFSHGFAQSPAGAALIEDLRATDRAGYAACCDVLASYDMTADLERIMAPTLVVAGRDDPATPPAHARRIADAVPGASLLEIAGAAHLAGVERPEAVTVALLAHLSGTAAGAAG